MYLAFAIFVLLFFAIVNRLWIKSFFEGFYNTSTPGKDLSDPELLNFICSKTGLKLSKIKLIDTKAVWALMAGLPGIPYMVISKDAFDNFSKDEMQWLLLHEAGHYILWHNVKLIVLHIILGLLAYSVLLGCSGVINPLILSPLLSIVFVLIYVQIARKFEYEANYFALAKMDNPKELKNIYKKAEDRWRKKGFSSDGLIRRLFNVWILDIYKDLQIKAGKK